MNHVIRLGLVVVALGWLAGCSGPEDSEPDPQQVGTQPVGIPTGDASALTPSAEPVVTEPMAVTPTVATTAASCAVGVDLLGYSDALNKIDYEGDVVGGISALAWTGAGTAYYALSDRGGRMYEVEFPYPDDPAITGAFWLEGAPHGLDSEGIAILPNGELLVASEVEPSIRQFTADGQYIQDLPVPDRFLVEPVGGGVGNGTFESLSLSPSGERLFTAMEQPLIGDGETDDRRGRIRVLHYDLIDGSFQPAAELLYLTEPDQAVSEVLAVGDDSLLVLERGLSLLTGFSARIFQVTLSDAEDVSGIDRLDETSATPLAKELLVDIADCPAEGEIVPEINPLLDNFESMSFGPEQPDGRRTLVLASDDNFQTFQITRFIMLAVDPNSL